MANQSTDAVSPKETELQREFEKWRDNTWRTVKDSEWLAYKAGFEAGERKERERCWPEHIIEAVEEYHRLEKGFADGTIGGNKQLALLNQVAYIGESLARVIRGGESTT